MFSTCYITKKKNKINTLYLQGPSNSCHSTIVWSIINMTLNYSQGTASQEFMYHNCANSNIIFFEELKITPDVVNGLKRVLEGSETCTNRKFRDEFYLPRTPVVALSNYDPWQFVPGEKQTVTKILHVAIICCRVMSNLMTSLYIFWR